MEGNSLAVMHLGSGPHWDYELEGVVLTIDGESVDLEAEQSERRVVRDLVCAESGHYKATLIIPPIEYELPEGSADEEGGEVEPPVRLPLRAADVELRLFPKSDEEAA